MNPYCNAEGVGVTPWSPLARGKLLNQGNTNRVQLDKVQGWLYESAKQSDQQTVEALRQIAFSKNVSCAQVALAWLLQKPGVVSPIVGATSVTQLIENARCLEVHLTEQEIQFLEQHYVPHETPEYQ